MKITQFDSKICQDLDQALRREWLETNGLGGYASSTIIGCNTRRQHGLLIGRSKSIEKQYLLLSHLDETIHIGDESYPLSTQLYSGAVYPKGYLNLDRFSCFPVPTWLFKVDDLILAKSIVCVHGEQTVIVRYQILAGDENWVRLELKPLVAFRQINALMRENKHFAVQLNLTPGQIHCASNTNTPPIYLTHNAAIVDQFGVWYRGIQYPEERKQGLDFEEDLYAPFRLEYTFLRGGEAFLFASVHDNVFADSEHMSMREENRKKLMLTSATAAEPVFQWLSYSASTFLVHPLRRLPEKEMLGKASPNEMFISGYPWRRDSVRDALLSLEGLLLVTGQHERAYQLISHLAAQVKYGLLPKHLAGASDHEEEYAAMDLPLWLIHNCFQYLKYTKDSATVERVLFPVLREIVEFYVKGTRYSICLTPDGLIFGGADGLTWMNGIPDNGKIIPRNGAAVEIQALWYNALCEMAQMAEQFGHGSLKKAYGELAHRSKQAFNRMFWMTDSDAAGVTEYLCDLVHGEQKFRVLRPNQLLALGLPYPVLEDNLAKWKLILNVVHRYLLTPYGLKTMPAFETEYYGRHEGGELTRAHAYEEGSVWPFFLPFYVAATLRLRGNTKTSRKELLNFLKPLWAHISDAGLGFASELFDGNKPHEARGQTVSAVSTATCLMLHELLFDSSKGPGKSVEVLKFQAPNHKLQTKPKAQNPND